MKQLLYVQKNSVTTRNIYRSIAILWMAVLFSSCTNNNVSTITSFEHPPGSPNIVADTIVIIQSDSSIMRSMLRTPKLIIYDDVDDPYTEFPEGFYFVQYNINGEIISSIKALYGKHYDKKELWEARQNVVAVTEVGDSLETELLFFDETKEIIYSDLFVKFRVKDDVWYGNGFESDIHMKDYVIKEPTGHFTIEVEE